jgi:hypothetical protein
MAQVKCPRCKRWIGSPNQVHNNIPTGGARCTPELAARMAQPRGLARAEVVLHYWITPRAGYQMTTVEDGIRIFSAGGSETYLAPGAVQEDVFGIITGSIDPADLLYVIEVMEDVR